VIQILSKRDIAKVSDPVLVAGITEEFDRLSPDFKYPDYGYFIVIEKVEELTDPIEIEAIVLEHTARPFTDCLELIEEHEGYCQVLLILHADFGLSLFVSEELISSKQLKALFGI